MGIFTKNMFLAEDRYILIGKGGSTLTNAAFCASGPVMRQAEQRRDRRPRTGGGADQSTATMA